MEEHEFLSYKLKKEIQSIIHVDAKTMMHNRQAWVVAAEDRREFIKGLEKQMEDMSFGDKKERSKYYSNKVIQYDKENIKVF